MKTQFHWTTEQQNGICPECGGTTALLIASSLWQCPECCSWAEHLADGVEPKIEVTGNWCPKCREFRAVSVNI